MQTDQDKFLGSWQVHEKVFDGSGNFIGKVDQKRDLVQRSHGILVEQHCDPHLLIDDHEMSCFNGDFIFEITPKGDFRSYVGPDVIGGAFKIGDHYLVGRGIWPRFGYQFDSWSVNLTETLQITGGTFYRIHEPLAVIIGVGYCEKEVSHEDIFEREWTPHLGAGLEIAGGDKTVGASRPTVRREQLADGWAEFGEDGEQRFTCKSKGGEMELRLNHDFFGFAKNYGPTLHWEVCNDKGVRIRGIEISLTGLGNQYSIRRIEDPQDGYSVKVLQFKIGKDTI